MDPVMPDMSPWLLLLFVPLLPWIWRSIRADYRGLADLIDPPKTTNDRKEAHR